MTAPAITSQRDLAIDVIRALCIVSMTAAHVAFGSIPFRVSHALILFDGAMGFVLLSGFVVGIVQRKTVQRNGLRAGQIKAIRRAGVVYLAHLFLCLIAFVVASISTRQDAVYAGLADYPDVWGWVLAALALQINPTYAAILSLYVILLLLTPLASWAMRAGRWVVLAAAIVVLYVLGQAFPHVFTLPRMPGVFGEINWALWQALYFAALIIGWKWEAIRGRVVRPRVWIPMLAAVVVGAVAARMYFRFVDDESAAGRAIEWAFADGQLGPGNIVYAFAVVGLLYVILTPACARWSRVATEIGRIGRRSLDCYVILAVIVLVVPVFWVHNQSGHAGIGVFVVALTAMWGWCAIRDVREAQATQYRSTPSPSSGEDERLPTYRSSTDLPSTAGGSPDEIQDRA